MSLNDQQANIVLTCGLVEWIPKYVLLSFKLCKSYLILLSASPVRDWAMIATSDCYPSSMPCDIRYGVNGAVVNNLW